MEDPNRNRILRDLIDGFFKNDSDGMAAEVSQQENEKKKERNEGDHPVSNALTGVPKIEQTRECKETLERYPSFFSSSLFSFLNSINTSTIEIILKLARSPVGNPTFTIVNRVESSVRLICTSFLLEKHF